MSSEKISALVKKAKKGDTKAFGNLYEIFEKEMYSYACFYLGDPICAEDAVSEAVIEAFKSIKSINKTDSFKSWLFTILIRCCKKQLKYVIELRKTNDIEEVDYLSYEDIHIDDNIILREALLKLDETDRQIVLLSVVSGYKSAEIGEMFSMPAGTVRSKLSRATDKLYDLLTERSSSDGK